jgi:hypothetical protein
MNLKRVRDRVLGAAAKLVFQILADAKTHGSGHGVDNLISFLRPLFEMKTERPLLVSQPPTP